MTTRYLVISSDEAPDRLRLFKQQEKFYNLNFDVINIDNDEDIFKGHIRALYDFIKSTDDYCVILETGVILSCAFKETLEAFIQQGLTGWGACWLGLTLNNSKEPQPILQEYNDLLMTVSYPSGHFGYLLTREVAGNILLNIKDTNGYIDVILMNICEKLNYPKLALKCPIVYLNVWLQDNSTIDIHEKVDLALYRRDFEIMHLEKNHSLKIYTPNLIIGNQKNDLSLKEIEEILNEFYKTKNVYTLRALKTWKQKIVTVIDDNKGEDYYGRALFYLSYIPTTIYIKEGVSISKLPIFPYMKIKYGKPILKSNEIFVALTRKHFIPRWTFNNYWIDTDWVGFYCDNKLIRNYFYSGLRTNKHYQTNISQQTNNKKLLYQLYRAAEEGLSFEDKIEYIKLLKEQERTLLLDRMNRIIEKETQFKTNNISKLKRTVAFYEADFARNFITSDDEIVSPDDYPDLLITSKDCNFPAKKHIVFSTKPEVISTENKIVISSYKNPRYLWFPEFLWLNIEDIEEKRNSHIGKRDVFCALTSFTPSEKEASLMTLLQTFEKVESAGTFGANQEIIDSNSESVCNFYQRANFVIICDDIIIPGLINMKLILAFMAGCIPIYLGPPEVELFFNEKAYINIHHYKTIDEFFNKIRSIQLNDQRQEYLRQSIFKETAKEFITEFKKLFS